MLGTIPLAVIARQTRSAMLEVLGEDYVRTARAKGLAPRRVVGVHAFRNALIPVVTTIGLQVGMLMAGAILTETIFSWPGIGKWMIDSIVKRDYVVVQSGLLLIALHRHGGEPASSTCSTPSSIRASGCSEMSDESTQTPSPPKSRPAHGFARCAEFWHYFSMNNGAVIGLVVFVLLVLVAIFAPLIAPHAPDEQYRDCVPDAAGPGRRRQVEVPARHRRGRPRHAFAPDLRRALLAVHRLSWSSSSRWSAASSLGVLAGYFRGWVDALIMRIMDIILAFPSLLLALVLVAILGPGLFNAMLAIALVLQPHFARLARAAVMAEKNREYVIVAPRSPAPGISG